MADTSNINNNALVNTAGNSIIPTNTVSPAVITSSAATDDLNKIKTNVADVTTSMQNQATTVNNNKIAADEKANQDATAKFQSEQAASKSAADKAAAAAKLAATTGDTTVTAPVTLPTDSVFTSAIANNGNPVDSVTVNLDGTRTVNFKNGIQPLTIDADPNDPKQQLAKQNTDLTAQDKSVTDTIAGIQSGAIPLNATEQAQIDGLKAHLQSLINQQIQTNANASGIAQTRGYQTGAAEYDPMFQAKTIGAIVTKGLSNVADLNTKMSTAVATLTQSFKDNDIQKIKDAYNIYTDAASKRTTALNKVVTDAQKAIDDAKATQQKITDSVNAIGEDLKKAGAPNDVIKAALGATSVADALKASGDYLQTSTDPTMNKYLQYKKNAEANGLTPLDYASWQAEDAALTAKQKAAEAYASGYSSEAGKEAASGAGGGYNGTTQKQQIAMEQQYRQILAKEFAARTGALGVENAKVNQANHLDSLLSQYYDAKTGNYNIPVAQYNELAMGLANLISPTGTASDSLRDEINKATAKGDIKSALQYITGTPQTGNTQAMIKNAIDSIDRQATTAVTNRQSALDNMKDLAPTDLDPARIDSLNKSTEMVPYSGQDRISKTNINNFLSKSGNTTVQLSDGPHSLWYVTQKLADTPGSTPQNVENYLKANGWMQ